MRPHRLVFYTDATARGGAEACLGNLLAALPDWIDPAVLGVDREVVEWVAAYRPDTPVHVVRPVRGKKDLPAIVEHLRIIRRLRPELLQANLRQPWSCQYGIAAGLLTPGVRVVAVEHLPVPASSPVQRLVKRVTSAGLAAHIAVGGRSAREVERLAGLPAGSVRTIHNGVPPGPERPAGATSRSGGESGVPGPERPAGASGPEPGPERPAAASGSEHGAGGAGRRSRSEGESGEVGAAGRLVIGTIGRLDPQKGIDVLITALAGIPDAALVVVGDGPERSTLESVAADKGVADRVRFVGWSPEPRRWLELFDVLALASRHEALPLTILEAMFAGLPVVATDVGSVAEAVSSDTGVLVPPDDPVALRSAISSLLDAPELRARLGRRAREVALQHFTVEAMAKGYLELYSSLLR